MEWIGALAFLQPTKSKVMRIVLIGPAYPYRGGLAAFNERLAEELQREGHEVVIVTFTLQYPGFLFPGKTQFSSDPAPAHLQIYRWINAVNPFNWPLAGRKIRALQPDLVICKYWLPFMGPALGTVLRMLNRRRTHIMALAHNIIPHESRPGDRWFTQYFVRPVDSFLTLSASVAEELKQFTDKPSAHTPHPIYDSYGALQPKAEAREALRLAQNGRYILFFGFIRRYKGLDILLEAMADPAVRALDVRAIVAGEFYDDEATYQAQIDALGLRDVVALHNDYIPHDEVRTFFGAADVVVQPYRTATQSGISQLAFHFEKPMIVTRVGGLPEIVGAGGIVTDVDASAIAAAIADFYASDRCAEMTAAVQRQKVRYGWPVLTEVLMDLYQKSRRERQNSV